MKQKRIKVRLTKNSPYSEYGYYEKGDIGYIDGYVNDNAVIILENGKFAKADLRWIEVVNEEDKNTNTELRESEDERIRKALIEHFAGSHSSMYPYKGFTKKQILAWLEKQGEQKQELLTKEKALKNSPFVEQKSAEWSEDDQSNFCELRSFIVETYRAEDASKLITWLESLKDRVQPQPKQEWSDEDEDMLYKAISVFNRLCAKREAFVWPVEILTKIFWWLKYLRPQNWTKEDKERYISCLQRLGTGNPEQPETINSKWFKEHVYPQPTWKPSDEQMKALSIAMCGVDDPLFSLYQDLKKLREE